MLNMEVVVGTYDEVLLGFRVVEVGENYQIETSFTDRSHAGCVKTIAVSNKGVLASGGTDETIRLLNLKKQRELGSLVHHSGTITSLDFHKGFMFSTSEDGKLCLWKAFTWECLRTFKGHKSAINSVSVHPSGKLALTVGADKSLHTWNLITGRSAFITNIKQVADIVKWSPDGERYLVVINNKIDVYTVETAKVSASLQTEGRINCVDFYSNHVCIYGGEGGWLYVHDIVNNKPLYTLGTQTNRLKGLCVCPAIQEDEKCKKWLCVCSSDGHIKIYKIDEVGAGINLDLMVEYSTNFRLTCLAVYNKNTSTHIQEESSETMTVDNSERTDKLGKNKNKKRKSLPVEEGTESEEKSLEETMDKESEEKDSVLPESKKLKKSVQAGESTGLKKKKDESNKVQDLEKKKSGDSKSAIQKKDKKKKRRKFPVS